MRYQVRKSGRIWIVVEEETGKTRAFRCEYRNALELANVWNQAGGIH